MKPHDCVTRLPEADDTTSPDISVCIVTFRRPARLLRLLESLQTLTGQDLFTLEVVVIDNDVAESAREVVTTMQQEMPHLSYDVEPVQSISYARNRSVECARGTWIAFIDDDEIASADWLKAYWSLLAQAPGDGYFGPVLPCFEKAARTWLDSDLLFSRPRHQTGARMPAKEARTGNALVKRSLFETYQFDPRFGLTGGGDLELFSRMSHAGAVFYWCNEAITYEYYPAERMRLKWLMQRAFRNGMVYTQIERQRHPGLLYWGYNLIKACGATVIFTLLLIAATVRGPVYMIKRLRKISIQIGHLWALFSLSYEEYEVQTQAQAPTAEVKNSSSTPGG